MAIKILLYLLLVFTLSISYILSGAYYFLEVIFTLLVLPVFSFILMQIQNKQAKVEIILKDEKFYVKYTSKSMFPLGRIEMKCTFENHFMNTKEEVKISFLTGNKEVCFPINMDCYLGEYMVQIQSIKLKDMLGIFVKNKGSKTLQICIMPKVSIKDVSSIQEKLSTFFNQISEDYDVREFQNHDSIKDIHYKLSYKMSKLLVKDKFKMNHEKIEILLDLSKDIEDCNEVFSYFTSLMEYLHVYQKTCLVSWYSDKTLCQKEINVNTQKQLLIREILSMPKANCYNPIPDCWVVSSSGIMGGEKDE